MTCDKCGEQYEDSVGSDSGMCQACWESYCSGEWWELWANYESEVKSGN